MKALIICEDDNVIEKTKKTVLSCGYDSIVYRWLLKALDNLEEISPDLIIVSSCDYPRHWKTFVAYMHACAVSTDAAAPKVILFASKDFSDDERKKAEALGLTGVFSDVDDEGLATLERLLSSDADGYKASDRALGSENLFEDNAYQFSDHGMMFTHPSDGTFVTGRVISISDDGKYIDFVPDSNMKDIFVGETIDEISIKVGEEVKYCRAEVVDAEAEFLTVSVIE